MIAQELVAAFGLGVGATLTPCALPLYPGFLAYLASGKGAGPTRWLGAVVLAGVLSAMLALGAAIALLQVAVGSVLAVLTPLADVAVILLGIALIAGRSPFARLPQPRGGGARGAPGAFVYGLLYGPIALPCSGPLLVSIFALSLGAGDLASKLAFFFAFGLGFGLPLLVISLVAEGRRRAVIRAFVQHERVVMRVAGVVLVAIGALDLAANLPFAMLYLGL